MLTSVPQLNPTGWPTVSQEGESEGTPLTCKAWSDPLPRMLTSQEAHPPLSPSLSQLGIIPGEPQA